jgi:ribose-phosphate pyrophosphokinase
MRPAICVAVHGVFAGNAYSELLQAGAGRVVTCNTVPHECNAIDVTDLLAAALPQVLPVS